jgi:amino acid transporter
MHNPARVIPLVMTVATVVVALLYALVALASVGVVPWQDMADQPLTVAGRAFMPGWAMTYFLIAGAGLAICTTLNSQFIQLPRTFLVASWDRLLPEWVGRLNRFQAPYWILTIMLLVGVVPLIAGLDIGDIARAATISASLPAIFVYWAITRIPREYPRQYAQSIFAFSPFWLWTLFVVSELSLFVGVYFLAQDLSASVVITLAVWVLVTVAYYPMRRAYLQRQGFDLNAATMDRGIFNNSSA